MDRYEGRCKGRCDTKLAKRANYWASRQVGQVRLDCPLLPPSLTTPCVKQATVIDRGTVTITDRSGEFKVTACKNKSAYTK